VRRATRDKKQRIKNLGIGRRRECLDQMLLNGFSLPEVRKVMIIVFNETISKEVLRKHRRDIFREHGINLSEARERGRMLLRGSRRMPWLSKDKKIRDLWYQMKDELKGEELTPNNL